MANINAVMNQLEHSNTFGVKWLRSYLLTSNLYQPSDTAISLLGAHFPAMSTYMPRMPTAA